MKAPRRARASSSAYHAASWWAANSCSSSVDEAPVEHDVGVVAALGVGGVVPALDPQQQRGQQVTHDRAAARVRRAGGLGAERRDRRLERWRLGRRHFDRQCAAPADEPRRRFPHAARSRSARPPRRARRRARRRAPVRARSRSPFLARPRSARRRPNASRSPPASTAARGSRGGAAPARRAPTASPNAASCSGTTCSEPGSRSTARSRKSMDPRGACHANPALRRAMLTT